MSETTQRPRLVLVRRRADEETIMIFYDDPRDSVWLGVRGHPSDPEALWVSMKRLGEDEPEFPPDLDALKASARVLLVVDEDAERLVTVTGPADVAEYGALVDVVFDLSRCARAPR